MLQSRSPSPLTSSVFPSVPRLCCFYAATFVPKNAWEMLMQVAGGAELVTLKGVGGWTMDETEELCTRINALALPTLMDVMDYLKEAVAELS